LEILQGTHSQGGIVESYDYKCKTYVYLRYKLLI